MHSRIYPAELGKLPRRQKIMSIYNPRKTTLLNLPFWVYTLRRVFQTTVSEYGGRQVTTPGRFPYSFWEVCEFFKVPRIGLVKVGRLDQRLNVPTQGRRVAQTDRNKALLTYGTGITSPAWNGIRAALVRDRCANHSATWTPTVVWY